MNENINLLFNKLIHKAFPEFSNKVTWSLIFAGISIIALPAPTYILFLNLIIDFYNKETHSNISLVDINSITPSNGFAYILIVTGLIYHIIIKGFQAHRGILSEKHRMEAGEKKRTSDITLYNKFIEIIPVDSGLVELLKEHDFGNSFHENKIKTLDQLHYKWGLADQHFHDSEIESKITKLIDDLQKFNDFISLHSNYINTGPLISIPTQRDRANDFDWSPKTTENVKKANEWSSELYTNYCDLIMTCKNKLLI